MNVTFTPTVSGAVQANLIIADNAPGSPTTVMLQGVGVPQAPAICFSSSSINFGSVGVGSTNSQTLTITNCGTAMLLISNLTITGASTSIFSIVTNTCSAVVTGTTCSVGLQFVPSAGGNESASLLVSDNVFGSPQTVSLFGAGSLNLPDAAISKSCCNLKKFVGFGVINTTGIGQEIVQNVHREAPNVIAEGKHGVAYYVAVKNDGSTPDQFTVHGGQIGGGSGWTVKFYLGAKPSESVDVTTGVLAGTFATSSMEAGAVTDESTMIRAEVFADKTLVVKGTKATFTLTFSSVNDPAAQDAVRITAVAK
jgi:hypothetical protein